MKLKFLALAVTLVSFSTDQICASAAKRIALSPAVDDSDLAGFAEVFAPLRTDAEFLGGFGDLGAVALRASPDFSESTASGTLEENLLGAYLIDRSDPAYVKKSSQDWIKLLSMADPKLHGFLFLEAAKEGLNLFEPTSTITFGDRTFSRKESAPIAWVFLNPETSIELCDALMSTRRKRSRDESDVMRSILEGIEDKLGNPRLEEGQRANLEDKSRFLRERGIAL